MHPFHTSSTSFGWGKGGKVTSAGWQVTLCDLIWHMISRSGVVISITNCYIRLTYLLTYIFASLYTLQRGLPAIAGLLVCIGISVSAEVVVCAQLMILVVT